MDVFDYWLGKSQGIVREFLIDVLAMNPAGKTVSKDVQDMSRNFIKI